MTTEKVIEKTSSGRHGHVTKDVNIPELPTLAPVDITLAFPYTQNDIDDCKWHLDLYTGNTNGVTNNHYGAWIRELLQSAKGIDYFIENKGYLLWFGTATKGSTIHFGKVNKFCKVVYKADDPRLMQYFPDCIGRRNDGTGYFDYWKAFPHPWDNPWYQGDALDKYAGLTFQIDGNWYVGFTERPYQDNSLGTPSGTISYFNGPDGSYGTYDNHTQFIPNSFNWHRQYDTEGHEGNETRSEGYEQGGDDAYRTYLETVNPLPEDADENAIAEHKASIEYFVGLRRFKYRISGSYLSQPIFGRTLHLVISRHAIRTRADGTYMPYYPADARVVAVNVPPYCGWWESIINGEMLVNQDQAFNETEDYTSKRCVATQYTSNVGENVDGIYPLYFEGPYGITMATDRWGTCLYFPETNGWHVKAVFVVDPTIKKVQKDSKGRTYLSNRILSPHSAYSYVNCNDLNALETFKKRNHREEGQYDDLYRYIFEQGHDKAFETQLVKPAKYWYWNVDSEENPYNIKFLEKHASDYTSLGLSEDTYNRNLAVAKRREAGNTSTFWKKVGEMKVGFTDDPK